MNITAKAIQKYISSKIKLQRISAGHYQFEGWTILRIRNDSSVGWWQAEHPEEELLTWNTLSDVKCSIYLARQ